jgi:adenylate cyclase
LSPEPTDHDVRRAWSRVREATVRLDTEPRLLSLIRGLRHRLPGDERFGDPLTAADRTTAAHVARGLATIRSERESALGELGLVGLQVWQSLSERTGRGRGNRPLALLFTDLVDFSPFALAAGDTMALELLGEVGRAVEGTIAGHGGVVQKRLGDGLLASFPEVPAAIEAALEAHGSLGDVEVAGYRPKMRMGLHWGRPRRLGGDLLGADVTIAAAVGSAARGGQLLVSAPALEQIDPVRYDLHVGRVRRLREAGAPRELKVASVRRRSERERQPHRGGWRQG